MVDCAPVDDCPRMDLRGRTPWLPATIVTALLALALPAVASANDYCVHPNESCGGTNVAYLEDALAMAAAGDNPDRIFLGEDTYTAPAATGFEYDNQYGPVEIIGLGRGRTTLTSQPGATHWVLFLHGAPGTSVHDLTIKLPESVAFQFSGLHTENSAHHIEVLEDSTQTNSHSGVLLADGGRLEDSAVNLDAAQQSTGVFLGTPQTVVRRSAVSARTGVYTSFGGAIERSRVTGSRLGVSAESRLTTISGSLIRVTGTYGSGIYAHARPYEDTTVIADGVTIVTSSLPDLGGVSASTSGAPDRSVEVNLTNSVIRGPGTPLTAFAGGSGPAKVTASYSDYDPGGNIAFGALASISESNVSNVGAAGFVDPAGGDYHLLPTSNLLDRGDPATPQGLDLDSNTLVADGNGDGIVRRDLGAFELQPPPAGGGQPGGGQPGAGPAADTQAPLVSGFRADPAVFAIARAGTPLAARAARGTRLRYRLSEPGRVRIAIKRRPAGRRRYRTVGTLRRSATSGANSIRFSGRLGKRALRPGRYRAVIAAVDGAGNRSSARTIRLRITAR